MSAAKEFEEAREARSIFSSILPELNAEMPENYRFAPEGQDWRTPETYNEIICVLRILMRRGVIKSKETSE